MPFSPVAIPLGPLTEFSIYHVMERVDPLEHFPIKAQTIGGKDSPESIKREEMDRRCRIGRFQSTEELNPKRGQYHILRGQEVRREALACNQHLLKVCTTSKT